MIGTRLGPFTLDRELGSGGMGKVYAAVVEGRCPGLDEGTRVALKVVHPHLLETEGFFKRFLREAEIGKTVRHPNVVRTYDCDAVGGQHFMAMEYVEGQTLRELLDELERVPEELCRHIAREVCKGLAAIHDAGVIHRDMKPDNVLITGDHVVKVMDLGVARLADEQLRLSQTGAFVGSIHYAAPEAFRDGGKNVDGRADLHALGLVLYELACGTNPYLADDVPKTLQKVLHEEPRKLGDVNPQLSPFFEEVVHCLLAKDADERFADANELLRALEDGEESTWWHRRASMIRTVTKRPLRRVRIPRETAVYGREEELTLLRSLFERASAGEGQVLLIEGEAGIGKSRLVDEFIGRLQREDLPLNFLFGSYPPGGAATASGGFSTAYREQFGEAGCADYLPTTPILVPAFDALLRGEPTPKDEEPLTKDSLQTCFVNATRALAAEQTTVVLIDDLHFAPDEGRALFSSLAMAVPGHRVLLIGTTRPGVSEDWLVGLRRLHHTSHVVLERLGPKDLAQLLSDSFQSARLAAELSHQISLKSDGNPFFVFEIIRGLRDGQFITQQKDGSWVTTAIIEEIQIPSSLRDVVNARIADLSEEARGVLEIAACWGFRFDPGLMADALDVGRIPLLKRLAQIERTTRLVRASGREFAFDHHQVQEVLYASLPEMLREEYHALLAETLEAQTGAASRDPDDLGGRLCVDLCDQFLRGGRGAAALRYLAPAQASLRSAYLAAECVALTDRALAVPGLIEGADRAGVLLELTASLSRLGRRDRQEACVREALSIASAEADDYVIRAEQALAWWLYQVCRYEEAEEVSRRCLAAAAACGERRGELAATQTLALTFLDQGRMRDATEYMANTLQLSRELGHRVGEAIATGHLGNISRLQGRFDEARSHYERQLELARALRSPGGESSALGSLGITALAVGRLSEAEEFTRRAAAISEEVGDRVGAAITAGNLGSILQARGRTDAARRQYELHLARSREIGDREGEAIALHNLGGACWDAGDLEGGVEWLGKSLATSEEIGLLRMVHAARLSLGALQSARGDHAAARESLDTAVRLSEELDSPGMTALALCELAVLPGGDAPAAIDGMRCHGHELSVEQRLAALLLLWRATTDRAHLEAAKRLLDESLADADDGTRSLMLTNLRVNREIMAACKEHGL